MVRPAARAFVSPVHVGSVQAACREFQARPGPTAGRAARKITSEYLKKSYSCLKIFREGIAKFKTHGWWVVLKRWGDSSKKEGYFMYFVLVGPST
eukprot:764987-Hanusia_phi.AAC.12